MNETIAQAVLAVIIEKWGRVWFCICPGISRKPSQRLGRASFVFKKREEGKGLDQGRHTPYKRDFKGKARHPDTR